MGNVSFPLKQFLKDLAFIHKREWKKLNIQWANHCMYAARARAKWRLFMLLKVEEDICIYLRRTKDLPISYRTVSSHVIYWSWVGCELKTLRGRWLLVRETSTALPRKSQGGKRRSMLTWITGIVATLYTKVFDLRNFKMLETILL